MTEENENALFQALKANPHDFNTWEHLIQYVESAVAKAMAEAPRKKMDFDSMPENVKRTIEHAQRAYDDFLARFPYCFGYWKKYAEFELAYRGDKYARDVFEKSVQCFPHSIDLWIQYCTYITKSGQDDELRELYERASYGIGLDFQSHPFFDIYLEFEEQRAAVENGYVRVFRLLERLFRTPMLHSQKYYDRYVQIAAFRPANEMVHPSEFAEFKKQLMPTLKASNVKITESLIDDEVKKMILYDRSQVYAQTVEMVRQRLVFEENVTKY
jgi:pre-mRNA-processing factor 39